MEKLIKAAFTHAERLRTSAVADAYKASELIEEADRWERLARTARDELARPRLSHGD
jgi:hypothetical protein